MFKARSPVSNRVEEKLPMASSEGVEDLPACLIVFVYSSCIIGLPVASKRFVLLFSTFQLVVRSPHIKTCSNVLDRTKYFFFTKKTNSNHLSLIVSSLSSSSSQVKSNCNRLCFVVRILHYKLECLCESTNIICDVSALKFIFSCPINSVFSPQHLLLI